MRKRPQRFDAGDKARLYTVDEARHLLGVPGRPLGRSTLYRLVAAKRVPYTLDPVGRVRFTDDDIAAILADGNRPAVA